VQDDPDVSDDYIPNLHDEDVESVIDQQETIKMPIADEDQAEIVTKFYDYDADQEDQENALVRFNNMFYQSTGIDIASADGETFDVKASLSGTVTEVKEDPILGNVVSISHENDVETYYASLDEVGVKAGSKVNPEVFFNQPVSKLDELNEEADGSDGSMDEDDQEEQEDEADQEDEENLDEEENETDETIEPVPSP